jgi:hypothetical protein
VAQEKSMSRAEDIYSRILNNGETEINSFIETSKAEELFLDFKRSANNGVGKKLHDLDREHLAKAISGFGNSEGGVIVWGVDCSKNDTGADVAHSKYPISDIKRYISWLEGVVSGCTIPPHSTVKTAFIESGHDGAGYAITYIPKSEHAPHQVAVSGKYQYRYYIRAGSNFEHTPHAVLAGMFGRRPQPHVFPMFGHDPAKIGPGNCIHLSLSVIISSAGPGIATDLFVTTALNSRPKNFAIIYHEDDPENWIVHSFFDIRKSLISKPDLRMAPEATIQPLTMFLTIAPPFDADLNLEIVSGCGQSPPYRTKLGCNKNDLDALYKEFMEKVTQGTYTKDYGQDFNNRIMNFPT